MSTTSTTKVIGTKSYVQLLAESFRKDDERYGKLMALGGFTLQELATAACITVHAAQKRVNKLGLYSEEVYKPGKTGRRKVYLPKGVKPPRK